MLEALADYHARDRYGFTPPGHRQGRGADPRAVTVIGQDAFRTDLLATAGLDDRKSSGGYLSAAEQLMADAVGASMLSSLPAAARFRSRRPRWPWPAAGETC
jgi:arginine decarboxylase